MPTSNSSIVRPLRSAIAAVSVFALACALLAAAEPPNRFEKNKHSPAAPGPAPVTLALDGTPPLPALPERNAASQLQRTLQAELTALEARATSGDLAAQAQHAWRRVAFDLLLHGAGQPQQALAIAGFRMADARSDFDALTARPPIEDAIGIAARDALKSFVTACGGGLHPIPSADAPEHALGEQLSWLRRAVSLLESRADPERADAWPSLAEVTGTTEDGSDGSPTASAGSTDAALKDATWLRDSDRTALLAALAAAPDPECAAWTVRALTAATKLAKANPPWEAPALRSTFAALAQTLTMRRAERLAETLEAAQRVNATDPAALPASVRGPAREIRAQALRSAKALETLLPKVLESTLPPTDPALTSAVEAQLGAWADIERLTAAAKWPDRLGAVRAASREPFANVTRNWAAALAQPHQRAATRVTMDAFAAQLAQYCPMRMETRLRANDPAAIAAAAGQSQALLAEIDRRRDLWAAAWARGSVGNTLPSMSVVAQTLDALTAVATFEGREPVERQLPRWGGFSAPVQGMGLHPSALAGRAKLAVEAVLTHDDAAAEKHLTALQRDVPVAWFATTAADRLAPWLAARNGVMAQVDALCSGPQPGSWLGQSRAALMLFSRAVREERYARDNSDTARGDELRAYLATVARELAGAMGETPLAQPALPLKP